MRVLITAFEPYGEFPLNASQLCLDALRSLLAQDPVPGVEMEIRTYPVLFEPVRELLAHELQSGYDVALLLGQSPRAAAIHLEELAVNRGAEPGSPTGACRVLEPYGPLAYRSDLPLVEWAERLLAAGVPAKVSYHAGTYLCNASLYWALHLAALGGWPLRATFVHLPLDDRQAAGLQPSLAASEAARGVRLLLEWLRELPAPSRPEPV